MWCFLLLKKQKEYTRGVQLKGGGHYGFKRGESVSEPALGTGSNRRCCGDSCGDRFIILAGSIGNGIGALIRSVRGRMGRSRWSPRPWWIQLVFSVLLVALGAYLLRNVGLGLSLFILLVGYTFIVRGLYDVLVGLFSRERGAAENRTLQVVLGLFGLVAGIVTLVQPVASGLAFIWVAGVYAIVFGVFTLAFALKSQPE
jgi:uncharacterized membrane protein HdeD (DUF308 family)